MQSTLTTAIVRLAEPIALTSIFPYAWAQVKHFQIGDESDASFYAGLLISSFSLAEALMGMYWGGVSDRIGRKPVLLVGCVGTMLSMLIVGVARNMWVAMLGRILGGLLNGNIGVIQTMVGELVKKPEHEPRAYSIMPFVWSIGTILGPAIGGTFADPHASFPETFPADSLFARFPYLLPNLLCALLLFVSIVLGYFLLEETHSELLSKTTATVYDKVSSCEEEETTYGDRAQAIVRPYPCQGHGTYVSDETPLLETSDALKRPAVDLRAETYGTFTRSGQADLAALPPEGVCSTIELAAAAEAEAAEAAGLFRSEAEKTQLSVPDVGIFSRRIVAVVLALAIFSYHSMAYDATLPIFFEDDRVVHSPAASLGDRIRPDNGSFNPLYAPGGLGLSVRAVGIIMAVNGAIALFVQAVIFPLAAAWVGVYRLFVLVTVLHPLAYVLVPCLLYVPAGDTSLLYAAIYACLTVRNLFAILVYPLLLILIKEATPSPSVLGRVNGLAASAGAACRMIAPPVAGYLYTVGSRIDCTALAWYSSALVALAGSVQCFSIARQPAQPARAAEPQAFAPLDDTDVEGCA
ncbi:major facilitator superfamily transporter [Niveomyces insectorum RCEF 264]|uniref:Major facilitator superfamily transporter n=1 Tax=Niveomyces insectorum RCEF 264 TaxID=1081102 RepID=A0A167Y1Q3_9HYPO|nr:major facilitator superfamily transporter [Niveomyces insectorum RCEF 264]